MLRGCLSITIRHPRISDMKKVSHRFLPFIFHIVLGVTIGFFVSFFLSVGYLYATGIPRLIPFVILSGSMSPSIPVGSVVLVQPQQAYKVGDVVTFRGKGDAKTFVTHRIIRVDQNQDGVVYVTQGDANRVLDGGSVSRDAIQGKVVLTLPYIGYLMNYIKTPQGFILFVIVPATILIYEELKTMYREAMRFLSRRHRKNNAMSQHAFIFPLVVSILPVVASMGFAVLQSGSFLKDVETSIGSVIGAASSFGKENNMIPEQISMEGGE